MAAAKKRRQDYRQVWLLFLLILILALALRLYSLAERAPGIDEDFTLEAVGSDFWQMMQLLVVKGVAPPGYYIIAWALFNSAGLFSVKLASIVFGALAIAVLCLLVKEVFGEKRGLLAGLLFALIPLAVFYSQHMRTYSFTMFLYVTSAYFVYSYAKTQQKRQLAGLTMANSLLIYTSYLNMVIIISELMYFSYLKFRVNLGLKWPMVSMGITVLSLVPWGLYAVEHMGSRTALSEYWLDFNLTHAVYLFYKFSIGIDISTAVSFNPALIAAFPLALALFVAGFYNMRPNRDFVFFSSMFFFPFFMSGLISVAFPILHFRFLSYLLPFFVVFLSMSYKEGKYKYALAAMLVALVAFWIYADFLYYGISSTESWNDLIGL